MSNSLAIASVTATLRSLLSRNPSGALEVTVQPPDRVDREAANRLNLFLYQTVPNAAWRNQDMPRQTRPGEIGRPPLALNLLYLITAYGNAEKQGDMVAQNLLSEALLRIHDHEMLHPQEIRDATQNDGTVTQSDLDRQIERVKLTPVTLTLEELSKLWSTFQTPYRISAVIEASVVLIESRIAKPSPLPVLRRGRDDRGVFTDLAPEPSLQKVEYRATDLETPRSAAEVGDTITLRGDYLPSRQVSVVIRDPQVPRQVGDPDSNIVARPKLLTIENGVYRVQLSDETAAWTSGPLVVELQYTKDDDASASGEPPRVHTSNAISLNVAPKIKRLPNGRPVVQVDRQSGLKVLSVGLEHGLGPGRRVYAVLSSRGASGHNFQIAMQPDRLGLGDTIPAFDVSGVPTGEYRLRIRADGVDSLLEKPFSEGKPLEYDDRMVVAIT